MNRIQANISLLAITFLSGIQYAFLKNVPDTVSSFAFLFVTNFLGLLLCLVFLGRELYRATFRQVMYSAVLAGLLLGFNFFMLLGSSGLDTTTIGFTVSAYIIFVPLVSLLFKKTVTKFQIAAILIVLVGLAVSMGVDPGGFFNENILYLLVSDVFFAAFIVLLGEISVQMNPAVLALGELFFGSVFSFFCWMLHDRGSLSLPGDAAFWTSAFFIAFFIRGMYGIVQVYAQRYVNAVYASLIFSTEIIFTLFMAPVLSALIGTEMEQITAFKIAGCLVIISGVLTADGTLPRALKAWRSDKGGREYE